MGHLGADGKDLIVEGRGLETEHLDEGLDDTSAMKVHRNFDKRGNNRVDEQLQGGHWAHLNQLLAEVVAKLVDHHIRQDIEQDMDKARGKNLVFTNL